MTGPAHSPPAGSYVFDRFRLSADGTQLLRDGAPLSVAPKALLTLLVLVKRAGQVVTRRDLLDSVWPDTVVEDGGLSRNISVVRRALGDDGRRYIATVPRIGYRFVAPLTRADDPARSEPEEPPRAPLRRSPQRIVGRERELDSLREAFDAARRGHGGVIAVTGEAGIGKTTVVEAFLEGLPEGCRVARGRCTPRVGEAEPYLPLLEAIDGLIGGDGALATALRRHAPSWCEHAAPRGVGPEEGPGEPEAGAGSAERLLRELTAWLDGISRDRPLVAFIDDLHWSDLSTVDAIAHLAGRVSAMRMLLVLAYRPTELAATDHAFGALRGELMARGELAEAAVSLLAPEGVREYVLGHLDGDHTSPRLAELVYRKTEGNPLFMVHLVRYLADRGIADTDAPEATRDVPGSLRGMIVRALQSLEPEDHRLLSVAAVHGDEFESAVVARAMGLEAGDVEERLQAIDERHGLVTLERERDLPDGTLSRRYRFVHVLYQDALFAALPPSRRVECAGRLAEALEAAQASQSDAVAPELAALYEIGRRSWPASRHFLTAATSATRRFAFREASRLARRGLACLDASAARAEPEARRREFDLVFALLVPLASLEGYGAPEMEALTKRLVELDDGTDVATTFRLLGATWMVRMARGECAAARDAGVRMVALARTASSAVYLVNAHMQTATALHHMGHFAEAQDHADAAIDMETRADRAERRLPILDPVVASAAEASRNLWITGSLTRASEQADRAVALARELRHPDSLAFAWLFHAWLHGHRLDWEACLQSVEAGVAVATESGSVQTLTWNRCVRGWAMAHTGRTDEGLAELSAAIEASQAIMGAVAMPQFCAMLGEVYLLRGDVPAAQTSIDRGLELSRRGSDRYFDAELHRLAAECAAGRELADDAADRLRHAIDIARSQGAWTFELRAAIALARRRPAEGLRAVRACLAAYPDPRPWPEVESAREIVALAGPGAGAVSRGP